MLIQESYTVTSVNRDKPDRWKEDILQSVDLYNSWFMQFAPHAFRRTRISTARRVESALKLTSDLTDISPEILKESPDVLPILRMATCPPIARDRLVGLAGVSKNLVESMEKADNSRLPPRMSQFKLEEDLLKISETIKMMADPDIFVWLGRKEKATKEEVSRAATVIADRLCGSIADPIIRNAQERRQLKAIASFLNEQGYQQAGPNVKYNSMNPGTYAFRMNIPARMTNDKEEITSLNVPVNVAVMPRSASDGEFPLLIETKSAGDFTNVNKRRKEEAQKMAQLRNTYGNSIRFCLFLCGYFDSGYLGYEAAEGIDWVWEHRMEDFLQFNL